MGQIDNIVNIALIGIAVAFLAVIFKKNREEFGILISVVGCILVFAFGISKLEVIIDAINRVQDYISINQTYIIILIKIIGITFIAEIASNICKDCGHSAVASQIELVGKLTILATGMPILLALLETINEFLTA